MRTRAFTSAATTVYTTTAFTTTTCTHYLFIFTLYHTHTCIYTYWYTHNFFVTFYSFSRYVSRLPLHISGLLLPSFCLPAVCCCCARITAAVLVYARAVISARSAPPFLRCHIYTRLIIPAARRHLLWRAPVLCYCCYTAVCTVLQRRAARTRLNFALLLDSPPPILAFCAARCAYSAIYARCWFRTPFATICCIRTLTVRSSFRLPARAALHGHNILYKIFSLSFSLHLLTSILL